MKIFRFMLLATMIALLIPGTRSATLESDSSYRGTNLTVWLNMLITAKTEQAFAVSSNAICQLGTNAVTLLVKYAETNFPSLANSWFTPAAFLNADAGGNEESLQVALGARVLGALAQPIYAQLTNNMRRGPEPYRVAMTTLINSGSAGVWELMRVICSTDDSSPIFPPTATDLLLAIENSPKYLLPIFIDIYEHGEPRISDASKWLLKRALGSYLDIVHVEELMPLFQTYLQRGDSFLKSQVLTYLGRCTHRMSLAVPVVKSRFNDPDETVRIAATNALNAIKGAK